MRGIEICEKVWGLTGISGYVGLACGGSKAKGERGSWEEAVFRFPADKEKIENWVENKSKEEVNIYWCPVIFSRDKRAKDSAMGSQVLYADLDEVNPEKLPQDLKPSISWKSSEKRYQGLWILDRMAAPLELEELNKRLSYHTGADRSGWDLTQVLRVPGTKNYQYSPAIQGEILHMDLENAFQCEVLKKFLPPVREEIKDESVDTLFDIVKKYKNKIPAEIRTLLQYPPKNVIEGKRSEVLFKIEASLVENKIPMEDIFQMIQASSWNKYRGRKDEKTRIMNEIKLAYTKVTSGEAEISITSEDEEEYGDFSSYEAINFESMESLLSRPDDRKGWMIEGFWLKGSNGIVAGEPKTFKSTITLDMALSVASGRPFLDRYEVKEQGPVVIIQNENADWIVKDRLERMLVGKSLCGDLAVLDDDRRELDITWPQPLPIYFLNNKGFDFGRDEHRVELEKYLEVVKPVLVIFDPLYLMFEGDINSAQEVQPILKWLTKLKNKYKTSIIVVHHFRKAQTERSGQRMLGSATFHGWTESSIFLSTKPVEVVSINSDLSYEEENKSLDVEIEVDREFRAAGIKPKVYLKLSMGSDEIQDYSVEIHHTSIAKRMSKEAEENQQILNVSNKKSGISAAVREVSTSESAKKVFDILKDSLQNIQVSEIILSDFPSISPVDLPDFCLKYETEIEPILVEGQIVRLRKKGKNYD